MNDHLTLFADGLLSKWGFGDGDKPEGWMDWADKHGLPYTNRWHTVLRRLVREHLLPVLQQDVVVYDIDTCHNPIRAETVDGIEVDHYGENPGITLAPESIDVPYVVIARMVADMDGWSDEQKAKIPT